MKIRIKGNFIRYRLTQSEVKALSEQGYFEEQTVFAPGKVFTYRLEASDKHDHLSADFEHNTITMFLPKSDAGEWYFIDKVGYEHSIHTEQGELMLLLEKDFVCLDETVEDQSDNYPHPMVDGHK